MSGGLLEDGSEGGGVAMSGAIAKQASGESRGASVSLTRHGENF